MVNGASFTVLAQKKSPERLTAPATLAFSEKRERFFRWKRCKKDRLRLFVVLDSIAYPLR